ncbi:MAG: hypothetical protein NZ561_06910 [Phycisphaerae bacterium]|nr:hypothetical protein [Phycisphaerae bacterium]
MMRPWRLLLAVGLLGLCGLATPQAPSTAPANRPGRAYVIDLEGEVNDFTRAMLVKRLETARAGGADTIILKINTWGGSALSALEISQLLKRQDDLHIIAFVEQKAISAGAMIAVACNEIVMQPGSMLGDCAPIVPGMQLQRTERAKAEGPILAEFADSAHRNGYDPLLISSMVNVNRVVYFIESPDGTRRFVGEEDYDKYVRNGDWKPVAGLPNPIVDAESLLTVSADQAAKLGLSKATLSTPADLAQARGLTIVGTLSHSPGEKLIALLSSDAVRGILSLVFVLSLYAAFKAPGTGPPEAIAVASLALLVGVPMLTGYAGWFEIILIVLGIALLATEVFVLPGFGIAGIGGICLILAGLLSTFMPAEPPMPGWLPTLAGTYDALWRGVVVITVALAAALVGGIWLHRHLPQVPVFNKIVLNTVVGSQPEANYAVDVNEPVWPEIGAVGRALTDLRPGGTAAFADEQNSELQTFAVVSESGFVTANTRI